MAANDTWCICSPLGALGPYMCHSFITLAASRTEDQPQSPVLFSCDADELEESHMATHLLRLWSTVWWILFYIQAGSYILALLGIASIECHSLTQNTQIVICLVNYACMFAHFCATGHIHTMVTGGLLALKLNACSSTATRRDTRGIKPWQRCDQS